MKRFLLALTALLISTAMALMAGELFLRARARAISSPSQLDPGLFQYDPVLGWRLTPYCKVSTRHHNYKAN